MPLDPILLHDRETCECVRCRGFQPGHTINKGRLIPKPGLVKHGMYASPLTLAPEAERVAELVRPLLPVWQPAFEGQFQSYCITVARIQKGSEALHAEEARREECSRSGAEYRPEFNVMALEENLRRCQTTGLKQAEALGLTPASSARIMRDASEGFLAQQQGMLTQRDVEGADIDQLERARRILLEDPDVIDAETV